MARPRHLATSRPGGSLPFLILAVLSSAPPARQADPFERTIRVRDESATPKSHRATGAFRLVALATEGSVRCIKTSHFCVAVNQHLSGLHF